MITMDRADFLPPLIRAMPPFEGPFDAVRLGAGGCEVLFATYPGGTETRHGPGDWYHVPPGTQHGARFERETAEIEFWFTYDGSDN